MYKNLIECQLQALLSHHFIIANTIKAIFIKFIFLSIKQKIFNSKKSSSHFILERANFQKIGEKNLFNLFKTHRLRAK